MGVAHGVEQCIPARTPDLENAGNAPHQIVQTHCQYGVADMASVPLHGALVDAGVDGEALEGAVTAGEGDHGAGHGGGYPNQHQPDWEDMEE